MSESKTGYVFDDVDQQVEFARLRALEAIFDPGTVQLLSDGLEISGSRCLEVGAGAGSIARWLGSRVGDKGSVEAVDLDIRFLDDLSRNIVVTRGDIRDLELTGPLFDLIHARFVLIHNSEVGELLDALLQHLAPGGHLALEEPDFGSAHAFVASEADRAAFDAVTGAIEAVFEERKQRHDFGKELPRLLRERGLEMIRIQSDCPVAKGGSPIARMMAMSTSQLGAKYLATGHVTREQLDRYASFSNDPSTWAVYHATVRVLAKKPEAT